MNAEATRRKPRRKSGRAGLTLIELIVAFTILLILSTMALPLTKIKVRRDKERRLRDALYEMRTAIDRYKDAADQGLLGQLDADNHGYPESLEILVEGVDVTAGGGLGGMAGMGGGMQGMTPASGMNSRGGIGRQARGGFGGQGGGIGQNSFGQSNFGQQGSNRGSSRSPRSSGFGASGFGSRDGIGDDEESEKKMRFLRKIPVDPLTGRAEWGMRSVSDPPDSMNWGGDNVFDVFSLSLEMSLDGTPYSEW